MTERAMGLYFPGLHRFFLLDTTYLAAWGLTFVSFYSSISLIKILFVTCELQPIFRPWHATKEQKVGMYNTL